MEKIIDPRCFWKEQVVTRVRFYRRRKFQRNKFLEGRYDSYYPVSVPVGRGETSVSFDDKLPRFYDIFARSLLDSFQYGRSSK